MASSTRIGLETAVGGPQTAPRSAWAEELADAVGRGVKHLLSLQASEGYWVGELEADTTLESDYIFYLHVLGKADPERIANLRITFAGANCRMAAGISTSAALPS